ncbi:MAG: hypothetical protein L6W00_14415 [Lentisphaeria bacterium]|nr:MAG: hypothetical protein L6W00_14415 [Lentisphaeria bacterium]
MAEKRKAYINWFWMKESFSASGSFLHLVCIVALLVGLLFGYLYMKMPDRVIVLARDNTIYLGNSASLDSGRVIEDIALRATYALLSRRYDVRPDRAISFVLPNVVRGKRKGS